MDSKQDSEEERGLESTRFLRNFDEFRVYQGTPKCVLVVDGGGLKGYMTIQILAKLEAEIKSIRKEKNKSDLELHQVFDLILGTSTGGLISIGLGRLRMTCKEISDLYTDVGAKVFALAEDKHSPKYDEKDHSFLKELESKAESFIASHVAPKFVEMFRNLATAVSTIKNVGSLSHSKLEDVFKEYIKNKTVPENADALMYDEDSKNASTSVKCGVIATLCNNDDFQSAMIIRSYNMNDEIKNAQNDNNNNNNNTMNVDNHVHSRLHGFFPGFHECKIWEAARATSAAPTYFKDMFIKMPKSIAIDTIECNICYATGLAKNPITQEFDMNDLYLDTVKDNKILHECAQDIYDLMEMSKDEKGDDKKNDKKEEDKKEDDKKKDKEDKKTTIIEKMKKMLANNGVSKSAEEILKDVMKAKYEMRFQDGGLSANSPVMIGFTEATRLWSDSDIVMLSVGTGQLLAQKKDFFTEDNSSQPHIDRIFATMFGAKDLTGLFDAYALSTNNQFPFHFQRMNPQVPIKGKKGGDLLDMADFKNMDDWQQHGIDFAKSHKREIASWAKFLVDNYEENQYANSKEAKAIRQQRAEKAHHRKKSSVAPPRDMFEAPDDSQAFSDDDDDGDAYNQLSKEKGMVKCLKHK